MGWKGTLRTLKASHNRSVRASERQARQEQKKFDNLSKKLQKIEDSREKVHMALKNDFAAGKLSKEEYDKLESRMDDVTDELLVFGKTPAVTLAKKYVCGKIDKEQFDVVR